MDVTYSSCRFMLTRKERDEKRGWVGVAELGCPRKKANAKLPPPTKKKKKKQKSRSRTADRRQTWVGNPLDVPYNSYR